MQLLIESVPKPDPAERWPGEVELPAEESFRTAAATGCRFYERCPKRMSRCETENPGRYDVGPGGHQAACFLYEPGVSPNQTKEIVSVDETAQ